MPLNKHYSTAEVEAAIARANGVALASIGAADTRSRDIRAQGASPYRKGTGHVFAHVATYTQRLPSSDRTMSGIRSGQAGKSLWQNRRDCIAACTELLNNDVKVKQWLDKFDNPGPRGKRADPIDVKNRPVTGDYYGYAAGGTALMKVTTAAINLWEVGGQLVIYSSYPCGLAAYDEPALDLDALFGT